MEDTVEEVIASRKPGSPGDESSYVKTLISNAKFVHKESVAMERFNCRFAPVIKPDAKKTGGNKGKGKRKHVEDDDDEGEGDLELTEDIVDEGEEEGTGKNPPKKRKTGKPKKVDTKGKGNGKEPAKRVEESEMDEELKTTVKEEEDADAGEPTVQKKRKTGRGRKTTRNRKNHMLRDAEKDGDKMGADQGAQGSSASTSAQSSSTVNVKGEGKRKAVGEGKSAAVKRKKVTEK